VRQHRVDLAGLRGQIGPRQRPVAIVAADLRDKALELADIAVDGLLERLIAPVFAADLVEGLLALDRVQGAGEDVALAVAVAVP
jgi:hypothetical protein